MYIGCSAEAVYRFGMRSLDSEATLPDTLVH